MDIEKELRKELKEIAETAPLKDIEHLIESYEGMTMFMDTEHE